MGDLAIYKEDRQNLGVISFINDIQNQVKIKDITDDSLLSNQLAKSMVLINNLSGIKEPMSDVVKKDIKEMILMRFKALSFDEVSYAFKLERYGELGTRIEHFQLFDAKYVSEVLQKYVNFKVKSRKQLNINNDFSPKKLTKAEIDRKMLDAVDRVKKEIKEKGHIVGSANHIYDFLVTSGRAEFSKQERIDAFADAKKLLIIDKKNEAFGDYLLTKKLKKALNEIEKKGNPRQIVIAKTLLVENYLKSKL